MAKVIYDVNQRALEEFENLIEQCVKHMESIPASMVRRLLKKTVVRRGG